MEGLVVVVGCVLLWLEADNHVHNHTISGCYESSDGEGSSYGSAKRDTAIEVVINRL